MKIRIWGARGSLPSPLKPGDVEEKICQAILGLPAIDTGDERAVRAYVRGLPPLLRGTAGGNTSCVEIQAGEETFVVDAGSGLQALGLELMKGACGRGQGRVHLFITHLHWDHLQGFPRFTPAYVPGNYICIYGIHNVEEALRYQQEPPYWPVDINYVRERSTLEFIPLKVGQPITVGNIRISTIQNNHPYDSYSYRFEDQHSVFVYASDAEYKKLNASVQPYIEFFRDADALIFDAQYTLEEAWRREDWGHSSAMIGVDLARAAGVKRLILFHHDPTYSDAQLRKIQEDAITYQAQDTTRPTCEVIVAYEGLRLDLSPPGAVALQLLPDDEAAILTPTSIFDERGVEQLVQQLAGLTERDTPASSIIDLSQVETLTTAGLKALVALRQERKDAPLVLVAPSESVQKVIELGGYLDFFATYPSVDEALAAVQAREVLNLPGQMIKGRYQIQCRTGEGRLGVVLKAIDTRLNHTVALKVLYPSFSKETIKRFIRQGQQIMALDHPNIVKVFDWDRDRDYTFKVEDFISGQTLQHRLVEAVAERPSDPAQGYSPLPADASWDIARDIISALEYAHSRGVVHGDLKPQNVFLTETGAKVSGFGLGRLEQGRNLFEVPLLFLTASYLAPEQILGHPIDARTDLYALGVILYQLFTGHLPFEGSSREVMQAHLQQSPRPPRELNPHISLSREHFILKLLAKNPNDRYASAQQARRVLSGLVTDVEDMARRYGRKALVGREKQMRVLQACWEKARAGQGQLVLITGEPGIGKTSLAQQAAEQTQAPVRLIGRCRELETSPAYHLFAEVLRTYFATVPPEFFDEEAHQLLGDFTRLVPEIRQVLPDLPELPPLEPGQEQLRLMANLTRFIKRATQERPWLLILDNLQWADRSSLELLRYLGRHLPSMPLLIIGIYHEAELEQGHPLLETLRDLRSHPTYRHIILGRLNETEVRQVLADAWQHPVPPALVKKIYHHTQGNPFYVEEVANSLMDDGIIIPKEGGGPEWHFPAPGEIRLPRSVREAVWRHIRHLSPDTQSLLRQAAVLGPTFRFDDLREMSGLSEWEVLERLALALERQLVQEVPGEALLRFRHPEIQHVLYEDLGPLRLRLLHRQAGETLERRAMPEPERIARELAYHFSEAGEFKKALTYGIQAARQAQVAYANESALLWYEQVLDMLPKMLAQLDEEGEEAARLRLLQLSVHQSLGEVLALVGRYDEALEHYTAAQTQLEAEAPPADQARQRSTEAQPEGRSRRNLASLCHQIAEVHEKRSKYAHAFKWLEKGLSYLDEDEATVEIVRIHASFGWVCLRQGDYEAARSHLEQALHRARVAGSRQPAAFKLAEADSLRGLGSVSWRLGDYAGARTHFEQALLIYREIGDRLGESKSLNHLGTVSKDQGDYGRAMSYHELALLIRREIGDREGEGGSLNNLGVISWQLGDYAGAKTYYEQSLLIKREIGDRGGEGLAFNNLGAVFRSRGDYAQAWAYHEQALHIYREIGDRWGEASALNSLGIVSQHQGDFAGAKTYHEQALLIRREIGDRVSESETLAYLGLLFHRMGDDKTAREYSQQALDIVREPGDRHRQAYALTFLGHALMGLGLGAEAATAYQQALHLRRELSQPNLATEPLAGLARVSMALGDLDQAQAWIEEILNYLESETSLADASLSTPMAGQALDGTEEPFRVYLTCYQVLHANSDPRALDILNTAYRRLQEWAANIAIPHPRGDSDREEMRALFLENVAPHQEMVSEWQRVNKGE